MHYTINELAKLAGISTRTLRYYDEIGLLSPARMSSNKYRIYGQEDVDRLQQILFYRELGVSLKEIKKILSSEYFDRLAALEDHLKEARAKYGDDAVDRSNAKLMGMSKEQYAELEKLTVELNETLKAAFEQGDPASELAQKACELHKKWLCYFWDDYSKEAHISLAQLYVEDPRFTAYYDKIAVGCAAFLRDAVLIYCNK